MFKRTLAGVIFSSLLLGSGCSQANVTGDPLLDLSHSELTQIPDFVFSRTNTRELDLSYNQLTGALPAEIRELEHLHVLDASHNQMTGVPAEIGQLSELVRLDLSYNALTGLPLELGNLHSLELLDLRGNEVSLQDLQRIESTLPDTEILFD